MNPVGAAAAVLSVVAFALTYAALVRSPRRVRWLGLLLFGVLAVPSVLFVVYYLHVLPERVWFYTLRSWRYSELLVIFLGCAGGALASLLPRLLLGLVLAGVIAGALFPHLKPVLGPLPDEIFADQWDGDACLQSTPSTCGPASVTTILRSFGIAASEKTTARAAYSYSRGTEAWYLARYVRSLGLEPHFVFRSTFSPSDSLPALVGLRIGGMGHFIAVLEASNEQVTYADPLSGKSTVSLAEFRKRYEFTGFRMVVSRPKLIAKV